jgi:hypothetical protein
MKPIGVDGIPRRTVHGLNIQRVVWMMRAGMVQQFIAIPSPQHAASARGA